MKEKKVEIHLLFLLFPVLRLTAGESELVLVVVALILLVVIALVVLIALVLLLILLVLVIALILVVVLSVKFVVHGADLLS